MSKNKAFGYLRVSGKGQLKGHGFTRQREIIEEHAKRDGIEIVRWFQEAHTGTETDRPVFSEMIAEILANGVRTIIVESMDRFAREVAVQIALLARLKAEGITLISASTGEDVTASVAEDPMKEGLILIQGVFAQIEKRRLVIKLRKAREAKREHGQCEGVKPFGEMEGEADTLDRIKALRRKPRGGKRPSFADVAAVLNTESRPTRTGKPWNRGSVHAICKRLGWE